MWNRQKIIHLIQACKKLKQQFKKGDNLIQKVHRSNLINYIDFKFVPKTKPSLNWVGIRNIYLDKQQQYLRNNALRITVYSLCQNTVMKLHDHPDMNVITYMLEGQMEVRGYTKLYDKFLQSKNENQNQVQKRNPQKSLQNVYEKQIKNIKKGDFRFLQMNGKNNLHEFKSVSPICNFIDILFPDYNDKKTCSFYRQKSVIQKSHAYNNLSKVILQKIQGFDIDFIQV